VSNPGQERLHPGLSRGIQAGQLAAAGRIISSIQDKRFEFASYGGLQALNNCQFMPHPCRDDFIYFDLENSGSEWECTVWRRR